MNELWAEPTENVIFWLFMEAVLIQQIVLLIKRGKCKYN